MSMAEEQFDIDIDIDICGACTLRCPSCPQGNVTDYRLPQGFMEPELLRRIVAKARSECRQVKISLFNWAEPLLHPRLPELVGIVQEAGIPCHLSSNLDILPRIDELMAANPASLRISLSGFTQETYGRTHRGGNIERVKQHMQELAAAKQRQHAATEVLVYYHRYRHNLDEEASLRAFVEDLGFHFHWAWALFFPLEKILGHAGEDIRNFPLTEEDRGLIGSLALPLEGALEAARKYRERPCPLRENALSLDFRGDLTQCCGVFDAREFTIGNFLDQPLAKIQEQRRSSPMCEVCMGQGAHVYLTYGIEEMDELALANLSPEVVERLDLRHGIARERRQQKLSRFYQRYFAGWLNDRQKSVLVGQLARVERILERIRRRKPERG